MPPETLPQKNVVKVPRKKQAGSISHRRLTAKHIHAATLVAEAKLSTDQICQKVKLTIGQFLRMRGTEIFQQEVARQVDIFRNRVDGSILGQKAKRNEFRERLVKKLVHVVTKRAQNADEGLVKAGGATGLVVKKPTGRSYIVGSGKTAKLETPYVYEVDHPTVERFQSLMNDIAKENGEMGAGSNINQGVAVTIVLSKEEQGWL